MNTGIRDRWTIDLRSGKYPQTHGALQRVRPGEERQPVGFCCLGVLCEQAVKEGIVIRVGRPDSYGRVGYTDPLTSITQYGLLPVAVVAWAGLENESGFYTEEHGTPIFLNDSGSTFDQIADFIEENT